MPPVKKAKLAPLALRHDVYYDLLELLTLSGFHQKQLLKRGLSPERIKENRYRLMPASYSARKSIAAKLSASYPLEGVPGFYLRDRAWTFAGNGGYLIPIYNKDGYIQGMQIRSDRAEGGMKYRWFSSNPAKGFTLGTKAQTWIHVTGDAQSKVACVTEDGLKGDVASYFLGDALFVCVPGVNSLRYLPETPNGLPLKKVVGAYDMDKLGGTPGSRGSTISSTPGISIPPDRRNKSRLLHHKKKRSVYYDKHEQLYGGQRRQQRCVGKDSVFLPR